MTWAVDLVLRFAQGASITTITSATLSDDKSIVTMELTLEDVRPHYIPRTPLCLSAVWCLTAACAALRHSSSGTPMLAANDSSLHAEFPVFPFLNVWRLWAAAGSRLGHTAQKQTNSPTGDQTVENSTGTLHVHRPSQGLVVQPLHDYLVNIPSISRWGALAVPMSPNCSTAENTVVMSCTSDHACLRASTFCSYAHLLPMAGYEGASWRLPLAQNSKFSECN